MSSSIVYFQHRFEEFSMSFRNFTKNSKTFSTTLYSKLALVHLSLFMKGGILRLWDESYCNLLEILRKIADT